MIVVHLFLFEVADPQLAAQLHELNRRGEPAELCTALHLLDEEEALTLVEMPSLLLQEGLGPASYEIGRSTAVDRNEEGVVFLDARVTVEASLDHDGQLELDVRQSLLDAGGGAWGAWNPYQNLMVLAAPVEVDSSAEAHHVDNTMRDRCLEGRSDPRVKARRAKLDELLRS